MATGGKLTGKVALVTGGSRGIGQAVSLALAGEGAAVVVVFQGNVKAANEVVGVIEKGGGKALAVKADVGKSDDVKAAFDKAEEKFGAVHVVAHIAGTILGHYPHLVDTSEAEWDFIMGTNCKGTFLVCTEAARRLGPGGRIITTSSTLTATLLPGYGVYVASKAAVEGYTKILAKELKGKKITVNCVAPGPVATEMFFKGKSQALIDTLAQQAPLERLGEPTDIAAMVKFIASDESEWLNGQIIRLNGGIA